MKMIWKITFGVVAAVLAVLLVTFVFVFLGGSDGDRPTMSSPIQETMPAPDARPDPVPTGGVDELLEQMEFGVIAFNAPDNINIDGSSTIQLVLSLSDTVEKLKQSISEAGERIGARIQVSNRMEARLSGYMFQITAITPEIQAVSKSGKTEWKWEVHPKAKGRHGLHLTLTALLEIDGHSTPRTIRTFDKNIEVTITATQTLGRFFETNWQWLWAAILVPVAGWLWKRKQRN